MLNFITSNTEGTKKVVGPKVGHKVLGLFAGWGWCWFGLAGAGFL